MNNCFFVGRLVADPELQETNGTNMVEFCLAINDYRTTKDGSKNKRVTYLEFEAWDTGAETIFNFGKKGNEMAVTTSARNNGRGNQSVRFRVNKFKIFNSQNRTQQENADEEVLQEQMTQ